MAKFEILKKIYGYAAIWYDRLEADALNKTADKIAKEKDFVDTKHRKYKINVPKEAQVPDSVITPLKELGFGQKEIYHFPSPDMEIVDRAKSSPDEHEFLSFSGEFSFIDELIETLREKADALYGIKIPTPDVSPSEMTGKDFKRLTDVLTEEEKSAPWSLKKIEDTLENYPLRYPLKEIMESSDLHMVADCFSIYAINSFDKHNIFLLDEIDAMREETKEEVEKTMLSESEKDALIEDICSERSLRNITTFAEEALLPLISVKGELFPVPGFIKEGSPTCLFSFEEAEAWLLNQTKKTVFLEVEDDASCREEEVLVDSYLKAAGLLKDYWSNFLYDLKNKNTGEYRSVRETPEEWELEHDDIYLVEDKDEKEQIEIA